MSTESLVRFFMARRKCSLRDAQKMADAVVIRRAEKSKEQKAKLEKAQTLLDLGGDGPTEEPTCRDDEPGPYGVVPF